MLDDATSIPGSWTWVFWSMEGLGHGGTLQVSASRSWRPVCSSSPYWLKETHRRSTLSQVVIVQFWFTVIWVLRKKKIVSFQRRLVKMPNAACFWHFQLLLNNSLASVTANVDLKAVVHFSTQMLSRQAWVLTNIFLGLPKATKNEFLVNRLF